MRIAIVGQPRSGTSSIMKYIREYLISFKIYEEPFNIRLYNPTISYNEILSHNDVCIKTMYGDNPNEMWHLTHSEFIEKLSLDFNHIVFLSRKDIVEQSRSYCFANEKNKWISPYAYNPKYDNKLDKYTQKLQIQKDGILEVVNKLNKKIYYYEDIYFDESRKSMIEFLNEIDIPYDEKIYNDILDVSKKYRLSDDLFKNKLI